MKRLLPRLGLATFAALILLAAAGGCSKTITVHTDQVTVEAHVSATIECRCPCCQPD